MKKFDIFIWASDYEEFTGEGLLARCFIKNYFFGSNLKIKILSNYGVYFYKYKSITIKKKNYTSTWVTKYFSPFLGIIYIWFYYIKGKKVCYLNYLPLWNFFIFLLVPKNTILGPVTGSLYKDKIYNFNTFIRKFFFPFCYFLSLKIIFYRFKNLIFSTDNLKKVIKKDKIKYCLFNFCYLFFKKRKIIKKDIDFIFYIRKHPLKFNYLYLFVIKELVSRGFKIVVVGDKFVYPKVINYVNLPRFRLLKILDRTKYTIASDENFFSLFTLDSLASGLFIFYNQQKFFNNYNINNFIPLKFSNYNYSINKIISCTKRRLSFSNKFSEDFFSKQNYKIQKRLKLINRSIL